MFERTIHLGPIFLAEWSGCYLATLGASSAIFTGHFGNAAVCDATIPSTIICILAEKTTKCVKSMHYLLLEALPCRAQIIYITSSSSVNPHIINLIAADVSVSPIIFYPRCRLVGEEADKMARPMSAASDITVLVAKPQVDVSWPRFFYKVLLSDCFISQSDAGSRLQGQKGQNASAPWPDVPLEPEPPPGALPASSAYGRNWHRHWPAPASHKAVPVPG